MENQEELLEEFSEESQDHIKTLEQCFLDLEKGEVDVSDTVNSAFRSIHTIKGAAGFFGLNNLSSLSHTMEELLGMVRDGKMECHAELIDAQINGLDKIIEMFDDLMDSEAVDTSSELNVLKSILDGGTGESSTGENNSSATVQAPKVNFQFMNEDVPENKQWYELIMEITEGALSDGTRIDKAIAEMMKTGEIVKTHPENMLEHTGEFHILYDTVLDDMMIEALGYDFKHCQKVEKIEAAPVVKEESKNEEVKKAEAKPAKTTKKKKKTTDLSVRVNFSQLSELIDLAGELILSRNQFMSHLTSDQQQDFRTMSNQISDLQDGLMKTRMQSLSVLTDGFPRIVRDLSKKLGKKVEMKVTGASIELDKNVIEGASAPFTHILRNSLDHGIEMPDDRVDAGKPATGLITINAFHKAGYVNIEVIDDGKGIDGTIIRKKAIEKGILTEEKAETMTQKESVALIYAPGFSTAEAVTDVSGRGVGMDVVKTDFEKLGGFVDLDSIPGKGTTLTIQLPLSVAIIQSLIVNVGKECYAIPRNTIKEVVKFKSDEGRIERVHQRDVLRYRDILLPVVHMADVLEQTRMFQKDGGHFEDKREHLSDRRGNDSEGPERGPDRRDVREVTIVVVSSGNQLFGVAVDEVSHQEETVVKNLNQMIEHLTHFMGITILSSGRVCFIIDVQNFSKKAHVNMEGIDSQKVEVVEDEDEKESHLVFKGGNNERFSLFTSLVTSAQTVSRDSIMKMKDDDYITLNGIDYRLIYLSKFIKASDIDVGDEIQLIIPKHVRTPFAIVATEVDGIELVPTNLKNIAEEEAGKVATVVFKEHLMTILDLYELESVVLGESIDHEILDGKKILIVEDTPLFQKIVSKHVNELGAMETVIAGNGQDGLVKMENAEFDIIISDIEMPKMNGYEFIQAVREDLRWKDLPVLALTTLSNEDNRKKGMELGFTDYLAKVSRKEFYQSLRKVLDKHHD